MTALSARKARLFPKTIFAMNEISTVWFDLDDTIWDFRRNSRISQRILYDRFSIGRFCESPEKWIETYERYNTALWNRYNVGEISRQTLMVHRFVLPLTELGMSEKEIMESHSAMSDFYLDILSRQTNLVPGAREAVEAAGNAGYKVGILSNGFREVQYKKLSSGGMDGMFDVIVLSDEIEVNKPDIRIFRYAEEKAGIKSGESLMIGDNPSTDIAGAVNAGWSAVFFNRDGEGKAALPEGVTEITDLRECRNLF